MRKFAILLALALMIGITSTATAQAVTGDLPNPEYTTEQIVNELLVLQGFLPITNLAQYEQPFETFLPGNNFTIAGYGMQSAYAQQAYAYKAGESGNFLKDFGAYSVNTKGTLLGAGNISFSTADEWGVVGTTTGGTFYSQAALNPNPLEVRWKLYCMTPTYPDTSFNGNGIGTVGFLAFEDNVDFDYNDLVLKIHPNPNPVPLPGAVLLLGAGMARLVAYSRRRK